MYYLGLSRIKKSLNSIYIKLKTVFKKIITTILLQYGLRKICQESPNGGKMKKGANITPLTSKKTKMSELVYCQTIYISK